MVPSLFGDLCISFLVALAVAGTVDMYAEKGIATARTLIRNAPTLPPAAPSTSEEEWAEAEGNITFNFKAREKGTT